MFARFPFKPMNWILLWPKLECYGNYLIEEEDVQPLGAKICVSILFVAKEGIKLDRDVISFWCSGVFSWLVRFNLWWDEIFWWENFVSTNIGLAQWRSRFLGGQWFARFVKSTAYCLWLWRSWQNSRFWHQRSAVRIATTAMTYFESTYLSTVTQKRQK